MTFNYVPGSRVDVPEISYKEEVTLAAGKTALIIVDMQNDFVKPEGNLYVEAAQATVPHIQGLRQAANEAGVHVAYTQDTAMAGDPEFDIWPEHCLQGTWGWQIIDELAPGPDDLVCVKNRYDGFYDSWLDHFLTRIWRIEDVVIVGTVSNICVAHTAASAGLRWLHIVMPANGISALTEFDQALTLRQASSLYAGDVVKDAAGIHFEMA